MGEPEEPNLFKDPFLKNFSYMHLPLHLQNASKPFYELATWMYSYLPDNEERKYALRKLLESKDCAVRAKRD